MAKLLKAAANALNRSAHGTLLFDEETENIPQIRIRPGVSIMSKAGQSDVVTRACKPRTQKKKKGKGMCKDYKALAEATREGTFLESVGNPAMQPAWGANDEAGCKDIFGYISELSCELATMSARGGNVFLANLLGLAAQEADFSVIRLKWRGAH